MASSGKGQSEVLDIEAIADPGAFSLEGTRRPAGISLLSVNDGAEGAHSIHVGEHSFLLAVRHVEVGQHGVASICIGLIAEPQITFVFPLHN